MQHQRFPPDDSREWLNRARSNLAIAQTGAQGAYMEDLLFEAQQAAEKAIKAVLIEDGIAFPYTHDLEKLLVLLPLARQPIPEQVQQAPRLSSFAFATRYPDVVASITDEGFRDLLGVAEAVVRWAEDEIQYHPLIAGSQTPLWPFASAAVWERPLVPRGRGN